MKYDRASVSSMLIVAVALGFGLVAADAAEPDSGRASLVRVDGIVSSVGQSAAEGGGQQQLVTLRTDPPESREVAIALAPPETLDQVGFEVEVGDRIRARIFLSDTTPALAHKVMNVSRGTMVRLRTLRRVPLWNDQGRWQGGPRRTPHTGPGRGGRGH